MAADAKIRYMMRDNVEQREREREREPVGIYMISAQSKEGQEASSKGGFIPAPEVESEPDFLPLSTPDSGTGSFPLESLEPIPRVELAPQVD